LQAVEFFAKVFFIIKTLSNNVKNVKNVTRIKETLKKTFLHLAYDLYITTPLGKTVANRPILRCFLLQPSHIPAISRGVNRFCNMSSVYSQLKDRPTEATLVPENIKDKGLDSATYMSQTRDGYQQRFTISGSARPKTASSLILRGHV